MIKELPFIIFWGGIICIKKMRTVWKCMNNGRKWQQGRCEKRTRFWYLMIEWGEKKERKEKKRKEKKDRRQNANQYFWFLKDVFVLDGMEECFIVIYCFSLSSLLLLLLLSLLLLSLSLLSLVPLLSLWLLCCCL